MSQEIYRAGCWGCLKAYEDPQEKYICPKLNQHLVQYEKYEKKLETNSWISQK